MREQLRKAGQALSALDDKYSSKIVDMYMGPVDKPREGGPMGAAAGMGAIFLGGTPASALRDGDTASKIAAATGIGAKYVAPLAGAGLALKGAIDMANVIGQQTPTTLEPN